MKVCDIIQVTDQVYLYSQIKDFSSLVPII